MSIFKCKMCGGTLDITEGMTVCECEYCGSTQTVPQLDDEKKINLFTRANRLRLACEFDKAFGVYESIVAEFSEEAEAYWGLILCKYGIEYVDDPATGKKIPTCHRSSFDSVMNDPNFEMVMEYSDPVSRRVYRDEAKQIEELRKGIIEVSAKEEPYDIFICYKETDENGSRTIDSVIAQDVYDALTEKGYKVFFSRITLEDKLGQEYEPYIFAALNSAKVMLAFGTDYEYYNAVWVKNEWSRFLALIAKGEKKTLIPCYKGIDAYDMPKEFRHLQAQDMGKVGAIQDLLRGIGKIIPKDNSKQEVKETVVVQQTGSANNIAPLLKRAFMYLEDGDWKSADEYAEKVLDQDPENAEAYVGKLMAELRVHRQGDLQNQKQPFDNNDNFKKIIRFGDDKTKDELNGYITYINTRNKIEIYESAVNAMNTAKTEDAYKKAADIFKSIPGCKDADTLVNKCLEKAEIARKDEKYNSAVSIINKAKTEDAYKTAVKLLNQVSGWKDADEKINLCNQKIDEFKIKAQAERLEAEQKEEQERIAKQKAAKKRKKILIIAAAVVAVCIAFVIVLNTVIIPNDKYNSAVEIYNAGKYDEAIAAFKGLNGYKDSEEQITKCEKAKLKAAVTGDVVCFGTYEQDNDNSNGKEDIEWLVLAKEGNKAFVISRYAIDCQQYKTSSGYVTWETCSLRKWLNGLFVSTAFNSAEQNSIISSTVTADKNPLYGTSPGNNTIDKVFLLSITEANDFFSSDSARQCQGTAYCYAQGTQKNKDGNCYWWLRSPGSTLNSPAANVSFDGSINYSGNVVYSDCIAVRPSLWINLGS